MKRSDEINAKHRLLTADDPPAVDIVNADSDHPIVFVCEHAGQAIPARLGDLGISKAALDQHIGWDIGAEAVTRHLAEAFGAPAVFQRYSRLVIDCNRPPQAQDSIPSISDTIVIPANSEVSLQDRAARIHEIFDPFQAAVSARLSMAPRRATLSIHSYNKVLGGVVRPWDIGFLYRKDIRTSELLAASLQVERPELVIGMNQPYQIDDASDWFVPRHGEARGIAHSLIEIRNDHIATPEGQARWADILTIAISRLLKDL